MRHYESTAQIDAIKVVAEANPKRAFAVTVTTFTPPSGMTWSGGMPLGLFKGVRTFTLSPENGATEQFAQGLKARAERAS